MLTKQSSKSASLPANAAKHGVDSFMIEVMYLIASAITTIVTACSELLLSLAQLSCRKDSTSVLECKRASILSVVSALETAHEELCSLQEDQAGKGTGGAAPPVNRSLSSLRGVEPVTIEPKTANQCSQARVRSIWDEIDSRSPWDGRNCLIERRKARITAGIYKGYVAEAHGETRNGMVTVKVVVGEGECLVKKSSLGLLSDSDRSRALAIAVGDDVKVVARRSPHYGKVGKVLEVTKHCARVTYEVQTVWLDKMNNSLSFSEIS